MDKKSIEIVTILGHTAGGKTSFATNLAYTLNAEIISADSRQVYREMNLGTGKDLDDYYIDGQLVPYHLIDIHPTGYKYNVYDFQNDFFKVSKEIAGRNKKIIMCGGSGLYIDAVISNYELLKVPINQELRKHLNNLSLNELTKILSSYKKLHNQTDTDSTEHAIRAIEIETFYKNNPHIESDLPKVKSLNIGINFDREIRRNRITQRLKERLKAGMIDEIKFLLDSGVDKENLIYYGLEYKFITLFLLGEINYDQMLEQLNIAIHQFAKRQMTWFRKMEKNGTKIHWLNGMLPMDEKISIAMDIINENKFD